MCISHLTWSTCTYCQAAKLVIRGEKMSRFSQSNLKMCTYTFYHKVVIDVDIFRVSTILL